MSSKQSLSQRAPRPKRNSPAGCRPIDSSETLPSVHARLDKLFWTAIRRAARSTGARCLAHCRLRGCDHGITDAKRSKAVQRCTPERMLYRFKPAGNRERCVFPAILTIRLSRQGPTCPHSQLQGTEPQSSALLRSGRVSWPNSRTNKGARPNACAWPAKPRTRPTRLCSSRWPKPGPGSLSRRKPEARTKNRNSAGSQPRPVITIAFGAIAVCGPPRRIKSSSETPSAAHF